MLEASAVAVLAFLAVTIDSSSFLGEPYPLHIVPDRDIALRIGEPLEIFCILNKTLAPKGSSAKDLKFEAFTLPYLSSFVANETAVNNETTVINETTARFYLRHPPPGEAMYYCKLNSSVRPISVFVGEKPAEVEDFNCISIEWNNLTCKWTPSTQWSSKTHYKLYLQLRGRAGRQPLPCPNNLDDSNNTCIYERETYRQPHESFTFNLTGTNALGSTYQTFNINHFQVVVPAPPLRLRQLKKTSHSCLIAWDTHTSFYHFPPGLSTIIQVKSERDSTDSWQEYETSELPLKNRSTTYNIEGLKFANTNYDVRVSFKNPLSSLTSHHASIIFRTLPTIPGAAPLTTPGCFDMVPSKTSYSLVIYWQMIEEHLKNGDLFEYEVLCLRNRNEDCSHLLIEKSLSYAKFNALDQDSYNFRIFSKNELGLSVNSSEIFVPKYDSVTRPSPPIKSTYGDGKYRLKWSYSGLRAVDSFTVFYCENNKEQPLPCEGLLNWETVPGNQTSKDVTVKNAEKIHQFGVAANYDNGTSSGISWATCVVSPNSVDFVVSSLNIHSRSSQTADVVWQLGCAESSSLIGYVLYYCELKSQHSTQCDGVQLTYNITDGALRNATINYGLKPYTTYQIEISIVTDEGTIGRPSGRTWFTTLEDAPDPPTNLRCKEITNSSISLEWDLPVHRNGVIQKFRLFQSPGPSERIPIEVQNKDEIDTSFEVSNLESSTEYQFRLQACTGEGKCSNDSNSIFVRTRIHIPDKIDIRSSNVINQTNVEIAWSKPRFLAPTFMYEVLVLSADRKLNRTFTFDYEAVVIPIEEFCRATKNVINLAVRAINIDEENNQTYEGGWSKEVPEHCDSEGVDIMLVVGACLPILLGICFVVAILMKLGVLKCKNLSRRDVIVKLPPGLEPPLNASDHRSKETWPPMRVNGDAGSNKPDNAYSDEKTLLNKHDKEGRPRGSYHESSPSESSDCPALPGKHAEEAGKWEADVGEIEDENNSDSDVSASNHEKVPNHSAPSVSGSTPYVMLPTAPSVMQPSSPYVTLAAIKQSKSAISTSFKESSFINGNGYIMKPPSLANGIECQMENGDLVDVIELSSSTPQSPTCSNYVPHKAVVKI